MECEEWREKLSSAVMCAFEKYMKEIIARAILEFQSKKALPPAKCLVSHNFITNLKQQLKQKRKKNGNYVAKCK